MNKVIGLLVFINKFLVSIESLVLSRRSWNVLCWGNHLSVGLADMLRQSQLRCFTTDPKTVILNSHVKDSNSYSKQSFSVTLSQKQFGVYLFYFVKMCRLLNAFRPERKQHQQHSLTSFAHTQQTEPKHSQAQNYPRLSGRPLSEARVSSRIEKYNLGDAIK